MTLYDPVTKQEYKGAVGTQGGYRGEELRYISIETGRILTTINPLQPQGFSSQFLTGGRPSDSQQGVVAQRLAEQVSLAPRLEAVDYRNPGAVTQAALTQNEQITKQFDLATRSASTFAGQLYDKYEGLFFANQTVNLPDSINKFKSGLTTDLQNFRAQYPDRDEQLFPQAVTQSFSALLERAAQGTPTPPGKLFGFIPIKVSGLVQNLANLGTIVGGAYGAEFLSSLGEVGATTSPAVTTSLSGSTVTAGGFSAELGIRGAQAVSLTAAGASGPASALGVTGLTTSGLTIGAAGGLVATAPNVIAVSPTALNLGVIASTTSGNWLDSIQNFFSNTTKTVKNSVLENPVKSSLSAAGAGLTLKKISEQKDPFAALVNTISSGLGIGPIIHEDPPGGPGPGSTPPSLFGSGTGGGGGGGGGYSGTSVYNSGTMLLPIMGILAVVGVFIFLVRR